MLIDLDVCKAMNTCSLIYFYYRNRGGDGKISSSGSCPIKTNPRTPIGSRQRDPTCRNGELSVSRKALIGLPVGLPDPQRKKPCGCRANKAQIGFEPMHKGFAERRKSMKTHTPGLIYSIIGTYSIHPVRCFHSFHCFQPVLLIVMLIVGDFTFVPVPDLKKLTYT